MALKNKQVSVLQDWVTKLQLREQGTLLTAVRGCDDEPKQWSSTGFSESPGRRITAFIRYCFMTPADEREIDIPGAFYQSTPPVPFRPSEFGHLPQHWYAHVMHALEIIGYRHPDNVLSTQAVNCYIDMVNNLHLNIESEPEMQRRLGEDRISLNNVVS